MKYVPETVLVLMRASAEVVRSRMRSARHPDGVVRDEDIEHILQRFDEEFARSAIRNKFTLDTTDSTPDDTFQEVSLPDGAVLDGGRPPADADAQALKDY